MTRPRLRHLLDKARTKRVAVIGDAMLDVYLTGDVERISPEAPVPVVRVRQRTYALGGAANVAQNVLAIGARCQLIGAVGLDRGGIDLRTMLHRIDIDVDRLVSVARCTTQKTRIVARSQQLVRIDEEEDADLSGADVEALRAAVQMTLGTADALILQDYNKGVLVPDLIREAIDAARQKGIPIVVDPKFRNFFLFGGASLFKPNRRELEAAVGAAVDLDHPEALPPMLARLNVRNLLLTLGEHGMILLGEDGVLHRIPTVAKEVYDVVGAGDTVTAYLAAMLAAGASPLEAATVSNVAAGIEVGKLGAATVTAAEVLEYANDVGLTA